jgi:hypothetical protein
LPLSRQITRKVNQKLADLGRFLEVSRWLWRPDICAIMLCLIIVMGSLLPIQSDEPFPEHF